MKYNLEAKLRKAKKLAESHFLAGNSVEVTAALTGFSKSMLQEWHDEFTVQVVKSGASRRIFLRELLLKNSPAMIMQLIEMSKQKGDEQLATSCAKAVLAYAARFMAEDTKILQAETQFKKDTDNDPLFRRGLFDIQDPDVNGSDGTSNDPAFDQADEEGAGDEEQQQLLQAIARLEERGAFGREAKEAPSENRGSPENGELAASQEPLDLFAGIDTDGLF